jgi:hypothetical protein
LLAEVIARLLYNKKILEQAKERTQRKTIYLVSKIEANRELISAEQINCPAASVGIAFLPAI